jgi:hypothetical protein
MNRRSFLAGIRNFAIGLAISPSLEHFIPEILPAETRVPPRLDESLGLDELNMVTRLELWPVLIQDFWFTEAPLFARLRENNPTAYEAGKFARGYDTKYSVDKLIHIDV